MKTLNQTEAISHKLHEAIMSLHEAMTLAYQAGDKDKWGSLLDASARMRRIWHQLHEEYRAIIHEAMQEA